jgi:hypothetical protein
MNPVSLTFAWIPAFRKTETALLWALVALIGWLQMQHKDAGFLTSQGADVVAPALLLVLTRDGKSLLRFVGLLQDRPAVIAAYGVGVAIPFMLDRWLIHRESSR